MNDFIYLALFSGASIMCGILLSSYLFFIRKEDPLRMKLLAGLILAISLRVGKSVVYYMTTIPEIGVAIGFLGLSSIGPFLWLFFKYLMQPEKTWQRLDTLHFVLPILGFVPVWLSLDYIKGWFYLSATILMAGYIIATWTSYLQTNSKIRFNNTWNLVLLSFTTLIWAAFFYQMISHGIINYAYGAAFAALVMAVLLIWTLGSSSIIPRRKKLVLNSELIDQVKKGIEDEQLFLNGGITLNTFSQHVELPVYQVRQVLRNEYEKSFPELMNHYRIQEVKKRLVKDQHQHDKIEGIAYDVGFNTPSAFYAAFKKETSLSPKEYRNQVLSN